MKKEIALDPELVFDPIKHTYHLRGRRLPNATWVLRVEGLIDEQYYTDYGLLRGNAVHKGCELMARGLLDWRTVDSRIVGYLEAYQRFLQDTGFIANIIEVPFVNEVWGYGVKPDQVGLEQNSNLDVITELKTGHIPKWAKLQTAAQALAIFPETWMQVKRQAVELIPDGKYRIELHNDLGDGPTFLSMLSSSIWKLNHGYVTL